MPENSFFVLAPEKGRAASEYFFVHQVGREERAKAPEEGSVIGISKEKG